MTNTAENVLTLSDDDLTDAAGFCRIIGGTHTPISYSTLWRGIARGEFPPPIKVGSRNRWVVGQVREVRRRAEAAAGRSAA